MFSAVESGSVVLIHACRSLAARWVSFASMVILSDLIRYCCGLCGATDFCWFALEGAVIGSATLPEDAVFDPPVPAQAATTTAIITRPTTNKTGHLCFVIMCGIDPLLLKKRW